MENESQVELREIEKEISPLVKTANEIVVNNEKDVDNASEFLKKIRDTEKAFETKRTELTKPINQSLKNINDMFKRATMPLAEARNLVSRKILDWKLIESAKRAKEEERRRKIQEAHEKKGHQVSAPAYVAPVENKIGNVQTVKRWTFEVIDFSKIPEKFKIVDELGIKESIRNGTREIPGIRIYQTESLSIVNR